MIAALLNMPPTRDSMNVGEGVRALIDTALTDAINCERDTLICRLNDLEQNSKDSATKLAALYSLRAQQCGLKNKIYLHHAKPPLIAFGFRVRESDLHAAGLLEGFRIFAQTRGLACVTLYAAWPCGEHISLLLSYDDADPA